MTFLISLSAPDGASGRYAIEVDARAGEERRRYTATVKGQDALEVDWCDEFQELMLSHTKAREDFHLVGGALAKVPLSQPIDFPITVG